MSKLDDSIATVAVALGTGRWAALLSNAARVAADLSIAELNQLPSRSSPTLSARKAKAPELKEEWEHLWFEALTEVLAQRESDGLPALLQLLDRTEATYPQYVIVRLLRLAASGCESAMILERIRNRLGSLRLPWSRFVVQEVEAWAALDPRPLERLRQMADIQIPGSDGNTIASHFGTVGPDRRAEP